MTLEAILEIAATGYPDPDIFRTAAKLNEDVGDTLALFLAREIRDTYDADASNKEQITEALRALCVAERDVKSVIKAFNDKWDSMDALNWDDVYATTSKEDAKLIDRISLRAFGDFDAYDALSGSMDLRAVHYREPLDLQKLLSAPQDTFAHDIFGICNNINRGTGRLMNCFSPRCTK